ncbi:MAG: glycosyltransferase family 9 protein [Desulfobacterales bacterium]
MPNFSAEHICLIRTSALGDTVHALALANGLKKGYPDARLTWILQPLSYDMVKHQPNIERFIIFERAGGIRAWTDLHRQLKKERFEIAVIPQVSFRTSFLSALVRADIKVGFDFRRSRELSWLFTNRHIPPRTPGHVQDQFFEFLKYLGIDPFPPEWNFTFTSEEMQWRDRFFSRIGRPVVSFVIASSDPGKDWLPARYAAVMDHVDRFLECQPMLIGGPTRREADLARIITRNCNSKPVIALEKPIRRTMLQLSGSALVVSPDTGPLHAAVALNVPTVGLYGYSDPRRCGPYRKFQDLLIDEYNDPENPGSPIRRKTRKGRMTRITPEAVIEKIELGLGRYGRGGGVVNSD